MERRWWISLVLANVMAERLAEVERHHPEWQGDAAHRTDSEPPRWDRARQSTAVFVLVSLKRTIRIVPPILSHSWQCPGSARTGVTARSSAIQKTRPRPARRSSAAPVPASPG